MAAADNPTTRLLVVEDSPMSQTLALAMLTRLGYQGVAVNGGEEALDALEHLTFAAILMDCEMPGMDGFMTTAEIRRREGAGQRTPIIAMTAYASDEVQDRCVAAGMDDFLAKPMTLPTLRAVVERWVSLAGASRPSMMAGIEDDEPGTSRS
jgi:CheY-like chemotaxis protein